MRQEKKIAHLLEKYFARKGEIEQRLRDFRLAGKKGGRRLFEELAFCLLTPQSKDFSCDEAVRELKMRGLLYGGSAAQISAILSRKVRFHNKKSQYIVDARKKLCKGRFSLLEKLTFSGSEAHARSLLLRGVDGLGLKEASHYLRNVGRGSSIAILDRHILKNLVEYGAIARLPKSLTPKRYLEIEKKMADFCKKTRIPLAHLDLLFWAEETGRVFK